MPFEAFEDRVGLLRDDTPAEYKPTGITLASARAALTEHMEALQECVANGKVPSEQLFKNIANGQMNLYKFADRIEQAFEARISQGPPAVTRHILELRNAEGELTNLTDEMQEELRGHMQTLFNQFEATSRRERELSRRRRELEQILENDQDDDEFLDQLDRDPEIIDEVQQILDMARARRGTARTAGAADAAEEAAAPVAEEAAAAAAEAAPTAPTAPAAEEPEDESSAHGPYKLFADSDSDDEH